MNEELYDAMVDLARKITEQNVLAETQIAISRALLGAIEENTQALVELKQEVANADED